MPPNARNTAHTLYNLLARNITRQRLLILLGIVVPFLLETLWHVNSLRVKRPSLPLDSPFRVGCQEPDISAPRENATMVMLARNEDLEGAKTAIKSMEDKFNKWFKYPVVFLNDKQWSPEFKEELGAMVSGKATFETIPDDQWGYPDFIDKEKAKHSIQEQGRKGLLNAGRESYHHMCRFYSGKFYDHPSLTPYKYFWRLEPDIEFTCAIPYDPFVEMRKHGKKYGFTVALWEVGETSPSLFRLVADYKASHKIASTSIWKAMVDALWAPFPIRWLLARLLDHRDVNGDAWNHCHFWSNFEIADLDFFRSEEYRDFFEYLDRAGGFYYERWGDAPVHSLAAALFLQPHELHRFDDFGYSHPPFWVCPANAWKKQLPESSTLGGGLGGGKWSVEREDGTGCRCSCPKEDKRANFPDECFAKFERALKPKKGVLR